MVKQKYFHIKLIKTLFNRLSKNYTEHIFTLRNSEWYFLMRCHLPSHHTDSALAMTRPQSGEKQIEYSVSSDKVGIRVVEEVRLGL